MSDSVGNPELFEGAKPCHFCTGDFLYFTAGSVACDTCQAEGPFCGMQFEGQQGPYLAALYSKAISLWNCRSYSAFIKASDIL